MTISNINLVFILDTHSIDIGRVSFYMQRGDPLNRIGPFVSLKDHEKLFELLFTEDRDLFNSINKYGLIKGRTLDLRYKFLPEIVKSISNHRNLFTQKKHNGSIRKSSKKERKILSSIIQNDVDALIGNIDLGVLEITEKDQIKLFFRYKEIKNTIPFLFPIDDQQISIKTESGVIVNRDTKAEFELLEEFCLIFDISIEKLRAGSFNNLDLSRLTKLSKDKWEIIYNGKSIDARVAKFNASGIEWFDKTIGESKFVNYDSIVESYLRGRGRLEVNGYLIFLPPLTDTNLTEEMALRMVSRSSTQEPFYKLSKIKKQFSDEEYIDLQKKLKNHQFKAVLRNYQLDGVLWLSSLMDNVFGGLLADEMGLGKTVQTLAFIALRKISSTLIVAPASVVPNWQHEIEKFLPFISCITDASLINPENKDACICIISYQQYLRQVGRIKNINFDLFVIDEGQFAKNMDTKTALALRMGQAQMKIVLTGTPIENSVIDLWAHLTFLNTFLINSFNSLKRKFPDFGKNKIAADISAKALSPLILRRMKQEVAIDIPPLIEKIIYCEMSNQQRELYETVLIAFRKMLNSGVSARISSIALEALLRLRQSCSHPLLLPPSLNPFHVADSCKLETTYEIIEDNIKNGKKTIVFSQFKKILDLIQEKLEQLNIKYVRLDGTTKDRLSPVQSFQNDDAVRIFLIGFRAGGSGLNLTAAESIILFDPWWNPAAENQAFARAHRIGQKKTVLVSKLVCKETIEEKMLALIDSKSNLASCLKNLPALINADEIIKIIN